MFFNIDIFLLIKLEEENRREGSLRIVVSLVELFELTTRSRD